MPGSVMKSEGKDSVRDTSTGLPSFEVLYISVYNEVEFHDWNIKDETIKKLWHVFMKLIANFQVLFACTWLADV